MCSSCGGNVEGDPNGLPEAEFIFCIACGGEIGGFLTQCHMCDKWVCDFCRKAHLDSCAAARGAME